MLFRESFVYYWTFKKYKSTSTSDLLFQFGEWPAMCYLQRVRKDSDPAYLAGASLIAPGIVLTAAHWV